MGTPSRTQQPALPIRKCYQLSEETHCGKIYILIRNFDLFAYCLKLSSVLLYAVFISKVCKQAEKMDIYDCLLDCIMSIKTLSY